VVTRQEMVIGLVVKDAQPHLILNDTVDDCEPTFKLIGVHVSRYLKRKEHVDATTSKAASRLHFLKQLKRDGVPSSDLLHF